MGRLNEPIEVMLDKPRLMVFNLSAAREVQKTTGLNMFGEIGNGARSARDVIAELFSLTYLRETIRASLLKDDPSVTVEQVGEWIDDVPTLNRIGIALLRTVLRFLGATDADVNVLEAAAEAKTALAVAEPVVVDPFVSLQN